MTVERFVAMTEDDRVSWIYTMSTEADIAALRRAMAHTGHQAALVTAMDRCVRERLTVDARKASEAARVAFEQAWHRRGGAPEEQ